MNIASSPRPRPFRARACEVSAAALRHQPADTWTADKVQECALTEMAKRKAGNIMIVIIIIIIIIIAIIRNKIIIIIMMMKPHVIQIVV